MTKAADFLTVLPLNGSSETCDGGREHVHGGETSVFLLLRLDRRVDDHTTRMIMANNAQESTYENEADMADESVTIIEDALEEVVVTYPSDTSEAVSYTHLDVYKRQLGIW